MKNTSRQAVGAPDYEGAWRYARERLENELAPELIYHSAAHTRDDVVPAALRLADMEGITGEERILLLTAAWFHDLGFLVRYQDNEVVAVEIARQVLTGFGFSPPQIETIEAIIMVTRLPQTPHNLLEQIMADADLDSLGREDYAARSSLLRQEMAALGRLTTDEEWRKIQVDFLSSHEYFTASARRLRGPMKQQNLGIISKEG